MLSNMNVSEDVAEYCCKFVAPEVFPSREEADTLLETLERNSYALGCSWDTGQLYLIETVNGKYLETTFDDVVERCKYLSEEDWDERTKELGLFSCWYEKFKRKEKHLS